MKTTMKKVLSMALALVLVMGMLPMSALATREVAAGGPGCYTANAGTKHTHANCVDGTHTEGAGEFDCVDANNSGYCDLCYGAMHTCEFGTNWVSNGTQHWHECACGAKQNVENHSDPDGLSGDANEHWNYCSICNTKYNVAAHTNTEVRGASAATCTTNGYTGNTWCLDCNTQIAAGSPITATGHSWEAATATTPEVCSICKATQGGALGTSTFNVIVVMGGVTQNGGSFTMTAGSTKTANDILNAFLATSTYAASNISSYYVTANGSQLTGNQTLDLAAASTYTLTIVPSNSLNNNQNNNNNNSSTGITIGFVPNYNTYTYATYVANNIKPGAPVYSFHHNITRTGYTLEGWYYDAATTQRVPNDAVVTGNATFYAKWTQIAPYNVSVVIYTNGNKQTPTVTLDLYEWAQDGVITLADLQQAVVKHGIKANNNAGLSVYGPFTPNQWTSYVSHDYFRNSTERVSVNAGEATVLYAMVHNVKITKGTVDPYGAIADKSNPKTGDMIYAPMMVLGLSASALAVLFYLNKKRAF